MSKLNPATDWRLRLDPWSIGNRRLDRHDALHTLPAGRAALIEIDYITNRDQGPDKPQQVHIEFSELADADLATHRQRHAGPNNQNESEANQESHQRPHHGVDAHEVKIFLRVLPIQAVKGRDLGTFLGISPDYPNAGKILLGPRCDLSKEILDLLEAHMHLLAKDFYSQRNQRHGEEQKQRQFPIDLEQQRQQYHYGKNGLHGVHDHWPYQLPHGCKIVGCPRHQIAGAMFLKKR